MLKYKPNIGVKGSFLRGIAGLIFIIVPLIYLNDFPLWLTVLLAFIGISLIVEGLLKWCVVRAMLGIENVTAKKEK